VVGMPRARNPNREKAFEIYQKYSGIISNRKIAEMLNEDEKIIAVWKSRDKWSNDVQQKNQSKKKSCTTKKNKGGQPKNKNSKGHKSSSPKENKNAEKHGLFTKYLPAETLELIDSFQEANLLDLLWDQIMIQYAAIIRSQQIMYVTDKAEMIKELKKSYEKKSESHTEKKDSESTECEYEYEFQFAWDRQATYLNAQSRAMGELRSMIKQYDEMLHKNWDIATEEQKLRISKLKHDIDLVKLQKSKLDTKDDETTGVVQLPTRLPSNDEDAEEIDTDTGNIQNESKGDKE
jgi:phage terminase small subunit